MTLIAADELLLAQTIDQTMAIYAECRRRSDEEIAAASRELRCYLRILIDQGDRTRLAVRSLAQLPELEYRPSPSFRGRSWSADHAPPPSGGWVPSHALAGYCARRRANQPADS